MNNTPLTITDTMIPIAQQIWKMKYQFKDAHGDPIDMSVEDTWQRIAHNLAQVEENSAYWEEQFYSILENFKFLPAGRITAGAGTARHVTMFNCFVMGTIPDSITGIFDMLKEAALTMQQGGGIGYDFSTLRPKGALVKKVAADASGPLSFMDVWDAMCRTIMSAGARRGAMMATMKDSHPDIRSFVTAKKDVQRFRMFNLSVLISDAFMDAVKNDDLWALSHKVAPDDTTLGKTANGEWIYEWIQAKDLWDTIMKSTYQQADPGVIFIDRINKANNLNYCEDISSTNPCGEQPLPPYGACLLGSINLSRLVEKPFTENSYINKHTLCELVTIAVRMLDNVIDISKFPLKAQEQEAKNKRRIGLGITGLADALIMCGLKYGSDEAVIMTETWMQQIDEAAYKASIELAKEKGSFPLLDVDKYIAKGSHVSTLAKHIKKAITAHGIRNALLTSIAPTGTISMYAGNVSSGIEPIFATSYTRKVLQTDGSKKEEFVEDYAVAAYRKYWYKEKALHDNQDHTGTPQIEFDPSTDLPDYFTTAQTLSPIDHIRMQAAAQKHIDSSISKTINCPEDISFEKFKEIYMNAYDQGCKGCTTYRPNDITGSILTVETKPVKVESVSAKIQSRPSGLEGNTYKLKWPDSDHAIYITINDIILDGHRRPFEVFINSKNMEHFAWTVAITRMISAVFRKGGDVAFVTEELKAVFDPRGGAWLKGKYIPSVLAAIGDVIENHMIAIGYITNAHSPLMQSEDIDTLVTKTPGKPCAKCGEYTLHVKEGCMTCISCGDSKCG